MEQKKDIAKQLVMQSEKSLFKKNGQFFSDCRYKFSGHRSRVNPERFVYLCGTTKWIEQGMLRFPSFE